MDTVAIISCVAGVIGATCAVIALFRNGNEK